MNKKKRLAAAVLFVVVFFQHRGTGAQEVLAEGGREAASGMTVSVVVEEALQNNPEIKAAHRRVEARAARVPQARSLDDPMLGLGVSNLPTDSFDFDREDMTMREFMVSQTVPFPGKLRLRAKVASREEEIAREDLHEVENRVVAEVKKAFYEIYFVDRAVEITERNRTLLGEFAKIAETKYGVGTGIQQDVILAQVEVSKILDDLIRLEQERRTSAARLNTLLDRPPDSPVGQASGVAQVPFTLDLAELEERALRNRPLLRALEREIARREAAHRLARLQYYPDFTLTFAYGQREGGGLGRPDFVSAAATVNIPLYFRTKQDERVNETQAEIRRARRRYESQKNEMRFALGDFLARLRRDAQRLTLFSEAIIPQARQSLDSTISGYQVNKVDFLTLLNNQVTVFNFERDYYRVLADYQQALADLELAVGERFY